MKHWAWSLTRFVIDFARLPDFKRQCDKYCVGESLGETSCSRRKADGIFLRKLDLSDETIVGVGQMRTTADIMCFSGAISACEKGENLGSSPVPSKKTNMCSIPGEQIVLNAKISARDKKHVVDHDVTVAESDAGHRAAVKNLSSPCGDHSVWQSFSGERVR